MSDSEISAVKKIVWTKDERSIVLLHVVEQLEAKNLPVEQWQVTGRLLMIAQLAVLDEERFRTILNLDVITEFQNMLDEYILEKRSKQIATLWDSFTKEHSATPFAYIESLRLDNASKRELNGRLTGQLEAARQETEMAREETRVAIEENNSLKAKVAAFEKKPVTGDKEALAKIGSSLPIDVVLLASHLSQDAKTRIEAMANVTWISPTDSRKLAGDKAKGKHAIVLAGNTNSNIGGHVKGCAISYREVRGSASALERTIKELVAANVH